MSWLKKKEERKKEEKKDSKEEVTVQNIKEELVLLQNELLNIQNDEQLQALVNPKHEFEHQAALQQGLSKKLLSQLTALGKQSPTSTSTTDLKTVTAKAQAVYELYFSPDKGKYLQMTKVADMEKKIADLEKLVGQEQLDIPNTNLLAVVESLKDKITALSSAESLKRKLTSVSEEIDEVIEKSKTLPPLTMDEQKIASIFEMMNKWDTVALQMPTLVSRLQSLKALHEESSNFSHTVDKIATEQEEIKQLLKNHTDLGNKLEETFRTNLSTIQSNVTVLEKRFADLSKKIVEIGLETY